MSIQTVPDPVATDAPSGTSAECQTTILFGAGASADAGVPLGRRLDAEIGARLAATAKANAVEAWEHLLALSGNFEEVYRLARDIVRLDQLGLLDRSSAKAHVAGADYLAGHEWDKDRLEASGRLAPIAAGILGTAALNDLSYLDPIEGLVCRQGRVTISTLNYDRVVETWAASRGAAYLQDDDPGAWTSGQPWHRPTATSVQLLKLHGSADWEWQSRIPIGHRALDLPVVRRASGPDSPADPAIILGAGNKLRAGGPYLALLEAFASALDAADHLAIVGYSFSDVHVNARIADWFDRNSIHRSVTVVAQGWPPGDGTGTYRSRFAEVLDRRLRLTSSGGVQIIGHTVSGPSVEPRLRVVFKPARDGLAEALSCPDFNDLDEPRARLRQTGSGR